MTQGIYCLDSIVFFCFKEEGKTQLYHLHLVLSYKSYQRMNNNMPRPSWKILSAIIELSPMSPPALFCFIIILHTTTTMSSVSATEFVYNAEFNFTNISLHGNATIQSSILTLTNQSCFSEGRAFYPQKIATKHANSSTLLPFATSFIFSIAPVKHFLTGHGFAFFLTPSRDINGSSTAEYLGFLNLENQGNPHNHVFGVEFDVVSNEEFDETNGNHVGIDVNSLTSLTSHEAGSWGGNSENEFERLNMSNGENYQVWIEFMDPWLNVTMAQAGRKRPRRPLISKNVSLSGVLLDEMYVGFCAATGLLVESTRIIAWSFSNSNFSIGDALLTKNLPSFVPKKWFGSRSVVVGVIVVFGLSIVCGSVVFIVIWRTKVKSKEEFEEWELEYWPHRFYYHDIYAATGGFSEENVIGIGGNGKVYKGVLQGVLVAVKRIPHETEGGMREFLAEVSSLGRMKHRNLVGLRGWSKREKSSLILVYDYMENGSLDKRIFECEESKMLNWEERVQVLKNVAAGILYLHEGWEVKVLHRDIKASNVLLDKDMNARLGDFGLSRMHDHRGQIASTTQVLGTVGYIAPEVIITGKASTLSDVFGFGILVLEVVCGRRPLEENKPGLVEWVMHLLKIDELHCALDNRLKSIGGFSIQEVEKLLLLGSLCANSDPSLRPTMRQVVRVLEGEIEGNESEEERMEVSLLEKVKSAAMWSETWDTDPSRHYPTIDMIWMVSSNSRSSSSYYAIPDLNITQDDR